MGRYVVVVISISLLSCILLLASFQSINTSDNAYKEPIYKKIEVTLSDARDQVTLASLGIPLHCGVTHGEKEGKNTLILEVSDAEYSSIRSSSLQSEVLIHDLSKFYKERSERELPKAIQKLEAAKKSSSEEKKFSHDMGCIEDSYPVPTNFNLGSMGGFTTYSELLADLDNMAAMYPNLITVKSSLSTTGQTTHEGRTIYYVKVSDNPSVDENEPEVLYTGLHHAREPVSMMNIQYFLWYLLENYNTDIAIKNIIDHTEMYFVPCVNPDGYVYNQTTNPSGGGLWRKNRRNNGDGTYGVDLNRNYGYNWGYNNNGSSPNTSSDVYRGPSPFSEPETQIMKAFAESHNFINVFNNHSYSNLLLHPWGYTAAATPDEDLFDEVSEHMCWHNRYSYGNTVKVINYEANGDSDSWYYGEQTTKNKSLTWTPEAGSYSEGGFYPNPTYIQDQCERHLHMSLVLAETATNHGILTDLTPYGISSLSTSLTFNIQHMGLTPGSFTTSISSSDPNVISIANPNIITPSLSDIDNHSFTTNVTLASTIATNTPVTFDIVLNNGSYDIYTTTITKLYNPNIIFTDDCSTLANWTTTNWGIDNAAGYLANGSITDSPTGNSSTGTNYLTMTNPVSLVGMQNPILEYYGKWDITRMYSYAQVEISTDGSTWSELCTDNTKVGVSNINSGSPDQPASEALYDGYQENFVKEEIDLSPYVGSSTVYIRFLVRGDSEVIQRDGFWLDDITIYTNGDGCLSKIVENTQSQITSSQSAIICIETDGIHLGNSAVTYNAGDYILLNPGFSTEKNFEAIIQTCQ